MHAALLRADQGADRGMMIAERCGGDRRSHFGAEHQIDIFSVAVTEALPENARTLFQRFLLDLLLLQNFHGSGSQIDRAVLFVFWRRKSPAAVGFFLVIN